MKTPLLPQGLSRSKPVLGAMALSAIALLGVPGTSLAADVDIGFDFLRTPGDGSSFFDFGSPIGIVEFTGVPDFAGGADTIIERKEDCVFVAGSCHIDIEMTDLSLRSINPVNIGGFNYDVLVSTFDPDPSIGTMWINDDGTFHSDLNVHFEASFNPLDGGAAIGPVVDWNNLVAWGNWTGSGGSFRIDGPVLHEAPRHAHLVIPTPEPSAVLGTALISLAALGLARKKNIRKS